MAEVCGWECSPGWVGEVEPKLTKLGPRCRSGVSGWVVFNGVGLELLNPRVTITPVVSSFFTRSTGIKPPTGALQNVPTSLVHAILAAHS